jgi:uncharacterized protein
MIKIPAKAILITLMLFLTSCSSVFYHPDKVVYSSPTLFKIEHRDFTLHTKDGMNLHGWHLLGSGSSSNKTLFLHFHGNAQNITAHYMNFAWLTKRGHDVMIFDYRGYGSSTGTPSPSGTNIDALTFLNYGAEHFNKGGYQKLVVIGQSLGGLILLRALEDFAKQEMIDLMILDSTFSSYQQIAFDRATSFWPTYLLSPLVYLLVSDHMAPKKMNQINIPALVVHGGSDRVVPYKFGVKIFEALSEPKDIWKIPKGKHIMLFIEKENQRRLIKRLAKSKK